MTKDLLSAATRCKKEYDAPSVEMIVAHVEKGFQVSGDSANPTPLGSNESLTNSGNNYGGSDFD